VNWLATVVANACDSSCGCGKVKAARGAAKNPSDIGSDLFAFGNGGSDNIACVKTVVKLLP